MKIDAERIQALRAERGWSQEELARRAGLNLRTIQRIERTAAASLRSKRALATVFDLDVPDLDHPDGSTPPCPECRSDEVYRYTGLIDSTTIGGQLVPKLASGRFSSARLQCVACGECGHLRYFIDEDARRKLQSSKQWERV